MTSADIVLVCGLNYRVRQSCKSGRAFPVGLGFEPGSSLTLIKTLGLFQIGYKGLQIDFLKTYLFCAFSLLCVDEIILKNCGPKSLFKVTIECMVLYRSNF